jgi:hypothetical protein
VSGFYPAPIQRLIDEARWNLAEHLYEARCAGTTWRELAEANGMHRKTVRNYAATAEWLLNQNGYGTEHDPAPSCNELTLCCVVCREDFTASRADARYCSNACRQDAYRKRKVGANAQARAEAVAR